MQNLKISSTYKPKLYESSVTEERFKASSLYQKRSENNIPHLNISSNYASPQYNEPIRKYSNGQNISKFATSHVGQAYNTSDLNRKDIFTFQKGNYAFNEVKSARRHAMATDRGYYNQNREERRQQTKRNYQNNEIGSKNIQQNVINQNRDDYARIVEKLNKKQKIIQQLQKLCSDKVLDNVKSPKEYHKGNYEIYSPVRTSKKYDNNISLKVTPVENNKNRFQKASTPSTFTIDLTKSQNFDERHKLSSSQFLNVKQVKKPQRKVSGNEIIKSNPQDTSKDKYKKNNSAFNSPKERQKIYDFHLKKEPQIYKSNFIDHYQQDHEKLTKKTILDIPYTQDTYSPVKTKKSQELAQQKQYRHAQDFRHILQTKNIQNNSAIYPRKLTIHEFDLKKELGEGKFGVVYQAFHKKTNSLYAIKKISKKVIKANLMVDQLLQEIKIQSFCNHLNILKLYGFFDDEEHIYLILQYMEEGTLFSHLKVHKTLKEDDVRVKLRDISRAVNYLHEEGIAHRDIKPENIVLSYGVGKLCDFGWATICTERRKTYCGTFDYVAPQILQGAQYDVSVDLWCLGVLAYELLVGKAPFYHISRKQTMKKIMKVQKLQYPQKISNEAIQFIQSLIKKNPQQRLNGQSILRHPFLQKIDSNEFY